MTHNIFSATVRGLRGPGLTSDQQSAVDEAIGAGEKANRSVATYAEREAIPLATRHYGLTVYVTEAGRDFRWTRHGHTNGVNDDWVGLKTQSELSNLGLSTGNLNQERINGLPQAIGSLDSQVDALRQSVNAIDTLSILSFDATKGEGAAYIRWASSGHPNSMSLAWNGWRIDLDGAARSIILPVDWTASTSAMVIGDSLSDQTWPISLANDLDLTLFSPAKYAQSSTKQALRAGAKPIYLTLATDILPGAGVAGTIIKINGAAPGHDNPDSILTTYEGDPTTVGNSLTGTLLGRRVTISAPTGGSPINHITAMDGYPMPVPPASLFIPDFAQQLAVSELWIADGRNNFNDGDTVLSDNDAVIRHARGQRIIIFDVLPATIEPYGSPGRAMLDGFNARRQSAWPQYYATVNGKGLIDTLRAAGNGSAEDNGDAAAGIIPRSLRSDDLHLNEAGYAVWRAFAQAYRAGQALPPSLDVGTVMTLTVNRSGTVITDSTAIIGVGATANNPFYANLSEAITSVSVGDYFTSTDNIAQSDNPYQLRAYKRIAASPFYEDQGDAAAPVSAGGLMSTRGAAGIGAQGYLMGLEREITLQDVMDAVAAERSVNPLNPLFGARKGFGYDSTAAVQRAIDFMASQGGGSVHITCDMLLKNVVLKNNVVVYGEAPPSYDYGGNTREVASKPELRMAAGGDYLFNATGLRNFGIKGLHLSTVKYREGIGISGGGLTGTFENLFIRGCAVGMGSNISGRDAYMRSSRHANINISDCDIGVYGPIDNYFSNVQINACRVNMMFPTGSSNNVFLGGKIEFSEEHGVSIYNASHIRFIGTNFDRAGWNAIRVGGATSRKNSLIGCDYYRSGARANRVGLVTITNGGSGYTSPPTVAFSGGGDDPDKVMPTGVAVLGTGVDAGKVVDIKLSPKGRFLTENPTITFSGGGGSDATATATLGTNLGYDSHFLVAGGDGLSIIGGSASVGVEDNDTGYLSPKQFMNIDVANADTIIISGLDAKDSYTGPVAFRVINGTQSERPSEWHVTNNVGLPTEVRAKNQPCHDDGFAYWFKGSATIAAGLDATFDIQNLQLIASSYQEKNYSIVVDSRDPITGARSTARIPMLIRTEATEAAVAAIGTPYGTVQIGGSAPVWAINGTNGLVASVSLALDAGAGCTLLVKNNTSNTQRINLLVVPA